MNEPKWREREKQCGIHLYSACSTHCWEERLRGRKGVIHLYSLSTPGWGELEGKKGNGSYFVHLYFLCSTVTRYKCVNLLGK